MIEMKDLNATMELNELKAGGTSSPSAAAAAGIMKWNNFPYSVLSHHGERCCDVAREWVLSIDFSQLSGGSPLTGPRWLRQKYTWGPSPWPMHWCEAVGRKTLDCGVLAALANEVFAARGVRSYPAQFIQQYTASDTCHWRQKWDGEECDTHWIEEELIYHEVCAVSAGGDEIKLWDPSAGWWVNPKQFGGYGGVLALRVFTPLAESRSALRWGTHLVTPNRWHEIETASADFAEEELALAARA